MIESTHLHRSFRDRRRQLLAAALGASILGGCTAESTRQPPGRDSQPNVLLIMADDLGVEGLRCYGSDSYQTPHLDALAASGVRFTNCYSQPLCTPSRVKIMTGKSNLRNYTHFGILDPQEITFAHTMTRAGYATAVAGKWQLHGTDEYGPLEGRGAHPIRAGFGEYCLWQVARRGPRYHDPLIEQNGHQLFDLRGDYGPSVFTEFLADFMARHRDRPFLAYYPMALVHNPFVPTPLSADRGSKDRQQNFADMVTYMDRCVGRLVAELERLGLRDNTIIIFTTDNGTNRQIVSSLNGEEIVGGKGLPTNAGTHVPLIVNWPRRGASGVVCEDLVDFTDFLPTLAEAAQLEPGKLPLTLDGRSFLPQVRGKPGLPRRWLFCDYDPRWGRHQPARFVRDQRWKLYSDGRLFDLDVDPEEADPVALDQGDEAAQRARKKLQRVLDRYARIEDGG
jgi:arylsulfatase A